MQGDYTLAAPEMPFYAAIMNDLGHSEFISNLELEEDTTFDLVFAWDGID
jgi:hypothetical protein